MRSCFTSATFSVVIMLPLLLSLVAAPAMANSKEKKTWRVSPRKAKIQNPMASDQASIDQGRKVYQMECENCHGKKGQGDGPEAGDLDKEVPNFTVKELWSQSDGAIYWKIRSGRRPMPSFKKMLSKDEIWHVTNFIRHEFGPSK